MGIKEGKAFDFKQQLKIGTRGEALFLANYREPLDLHPENDGDFVVRSTGAKLELKTDSYSMDKTENFFVERWSDLQRQRPGGPWQALGHGCSLFVYLFVNNATYFEFRDLPKLVERLEDLTKDKGFVTVRNKAWTTAGFKVKREALKDLCTQYTFTS